MSTSSTSTVTSWPTSTTSLGWSMCFQDNSETCTSPSTPPRSTNAPKLTMDETTPLRIWPFCSVLRKVWRTSDCVCSSHARRERTTLLRFLSSSMIFASSSRPTYGCRSRTRRISTSEAGRKPRKPMSRISPPLTTSITVPVTTPSSSLIFSIVPHARSYCARFLDRIKRPSLSSFCRTSASMCSPVLTTSCGSTSCLIDSSPAGSIGTASRKHLEVPGGRGQRRLMTCLFPGAAGAERHLQGHRQLTRAAHIRGDQLAQRVELAGRDLEDQLVMHLKQHPRAQALPPQGAIHRKHRHLDNVGRRSLDRRVESHPFGHLSTLPVIGQQVGQVPAASEDRLGVTVLARPLNNGAQVVAHPAEPLEVLGHQPARLVRCDPQLLGKTVGGQAVGQAVIHRLDPGS